MSLRSGKEGTKAGQRVRTVLIVDDDDLVRRGYARDFRSRGFEVHVANGYDEALAVARKVNIELAVIDLRMPDHSGLEVLTALRQGNLCRRSVLLTGYGSIPTAVESMRRGATHYLTKPVSASAILAALDGLKPVARALDPQDDSLDLPSLARTEWEHLHRALAEAKGNISEAARRLKIPRRTLQRKLRKNPPPE